MSRFGGKVQNVVPRPTVPAMRLTVRLHGFSEKERRVDVADDATYDDVLRALEVPSETVVVFADKRPVPIDAPLEADQDIRVVRVVSGGQSPRHA